MIETTAVTGGHWTAMNEYNINELVLTPDIQLIKNLAQNPAESTIWMLGLRARLAF